MASTISSIRTTKKVPGDPGVARAPLQAGGPDTRLTIVTPVDHLVHYTTLLAIERAQPSGGSIRILPETQEEGRRRPTKHWRGHVAAQSMASKCYDGSKEPSFTRPPL